METAVDILTEVSRCLFTSEAVHLFRAKPSTDSERKLSGLSGDP